jgi:predicted nucleotidyltransferase
MQKNELRNRRSKENDYKTSFKKTKVTKTILEIKEILVSHKDLLRKKYAVKSLAIFGSYVRGEQKEESDVDILVEFNQPVGFVFIELGDLLDELLGVKVDLLTLEMVRKNPLLKEEIEKELYYV